MRTLMIHALGALFALTLSAVEVRADEDLDAELDAEWGNRGVKTQKAETVESRFEAQLKLLEAQRDAAKERCRDKGGGSYCVSYAEENFRKEERALRKRFESEGVELPDAPEKSRGFGRRD